MAMERVAEKREPERVLLRSMVSSVRMRSEIAVHHTVVVRRKKIASLVQSELIRDGLTDGCELQAAEILAAKREL